MSVFTASREKRGRPRGYADWRPHAETWALLDQVVDVLDEYRQQDLLPLTVRQIYYRLVTTAGYPKTTQSYARLSEHLIRARRARIIPFEEIRDDEIVTSQRDCHAGVADFWDDTALRIRRYQRTRQEGQPCFIELWCEAKGMIPTLARIAGAYSVPVYSCGGYTSVTANREVVDRALGRNGLTLLLHVGDHDPSGEDIFAAMTADVAAFVKADRVLATQDVEAERVALTRAQVAEYDLPTAPAKASDGRAGSWAGGTCQLEALPPEVLAEIVHEAIVERRDLALLEQVMRAEEEDRRDLFGELPAGPA